MHSPQNKQGAYGGKPTVYSRPSLFEQRRQCLQQGGPAIFFKAFEGIGRGSLQHIVSQHVDEYRSQRRKPKSAGRSHGRWQALHVGRVDSVDASFRVVTRDQVANGDILDLILSLAPTRRKPPPWDVVQDVPQALTSHRRPQTCEHGDGKQTPVWDYLRAFTQIATQRCNRVLTQRHDALGRVHAICKIIDGCLHLGLPIRGTWHKGRGGMLRGMKFPSRARNSPHRMVVEQSNGVVP